MWKLKGTLSAYWKYPRQEPASTTARHCRWCSPDLETWDLCRLEGEAKELTAQGTQPKGFFSQTVLLKATPRRNARCCLTYCIEGIFKELGEIPIGCATSLFPPCVKETLFLGGWRGQRSCCLFACWLYFYVYFLLACCSKKWKKKYSLIENLKFPLMQEIILIMCSNCRVQINTSH